MSLNIFQQVFANVDSNTKKMLIKENENPNQPVEIPKKKVHQKKKVSLPKEPPKKPTLEEEMGPIFKKIRSPNKGQTLPLQSTKKVEVVEPKKEENTKPTPNAEKNLNLVIFYNEEITVDNSIPQYNNSANEIKSEDEIVEEVEKVDPEIAEATKTIIDNMFPDFNEPYIEKKVEEPKNKLQISHNQQELDFPSKNEMMAEILELAKTPPPPEIQLVDSSSYSSFSESKPVIEEAFEEIKPSRLTTPRSAKRGIPIHVSPMTHQYINTNLLSESERNEREEAIQLLEEMKLKYSQMIDMKNEARSALNLEISKHKELEKQGYEMDNKLNQLSHENNQLDEILKTIEEDFVDKEAESEERWEFQANELQIELDALKQQLSKTVKELNTPKHVHTEWCLYEDPPNTTEEGKQDDDSKISSLEEFQLSLSELCSFLDESLKNKTTECQIIRGKVYILCNLLGKITDYYTKISALPSFNKENDLNTGERKNELINFLIKKASSLLYVAQILKTYTEFLANPGQPEYDYWEELYQIYINISPALDEFFNVLSQIFEIIPENVIIEEMTHFMNDKDINTVTKSRAEVLLDKTHKLQVLVQELSDIVQNGSYHSFFSIFSRNTDYMLNVQAKLLEIEALWDFFVEIKDNFFNMDDNTLPAYSWNGKDFMISEYDQLINLFNNIKENVMDSISIGLEDKIKDFQKKYEFLFYNFIKPLCDIAKQSDIKIIDTYNPDEMAFSDSIGTRNDQKTENNPQTSMISFPELTDCDTNLSFKTDLPELLTSSDQIENTTKEREITKEDNEFYEKNRLSIDQVKGFFNIFHNNPWR